MIKPNANVLKKHICLTTLGITLQIIGSLCLCSATLVMMQEINSQLKQVLIKKLSD